MRRGGVPAVIIGMLFLSPMGVARMGSQQDPPAVARGGGSMGTTHVLCRMNCGLHAMAQAHVCG